MNLEVDLGSEKENIKDQFNNTKFVLDESESEVVEIETPRGGSSLPEPDEGGDYLKSFIYGGMDGEKK